MASVSMIRGTKAQIESTPRVDGQILIETDQGNLNKIYVDINEGGTVNRYMAGGGGHEMIPEPNASLDENDVVDAIKDPNIDGANEQVASLFGIQQWSNTCTKRYIIDNSEGDAIGTQGIGEWQEELDPSDPPSAEDEAGWGWWYNDGFILPSGVDENSIDLSIKFDPSINEPIVLGGYIYDTTTGYICIKFANTISADALPNAKVAVDITYTRTNIN